MLSTVTDKEKQTKELMSFVAQISPQELNQVLEQVRSIPVSSRKVRITQEMKRYITSVEKNTTNVLVAIKKLQKINEPIADEVWNEIEMILNKISLANYKQSAMNIIHEENRGRPSMNVIETVSKVEDIVPEDTEIVTLKRGRGRPKGSSNKPKVEAVASESTEVTTLKRGRGRPKGSSNKPKVEAVASESAEVTTSKRGPGRPKKTETLFREQISVENTDKKDLSLYEQWELEQAKKGHAVPKERKGRTPSLVA